MFFMAPVVSFAADAADGGWIPNSAKLQRSGWTTELSAHGRWQAADARMLGSDRLEVYERVRS